MKTHGIGTGIEKQIKETELKTQKQIPEYRRTLCMIKVLYFNAVREKVIYLIHSVGPMGY